MLVALGLSEVGRPPGCCARLKGRWRRENLYAGGVSECGPIAAELRDERLPREIFHSLKEAQVVVEH